MATPCVYERQTEYWTSRGVEDYFLDAGFQVLTFPLTQRTESEVPFDFIFLEGKTSKMFGLQYKALYQNQRDHWCLDQAQHHSLQAFRDWGYYCLSEVTRTDQLRVAIHHALFVPVSLDFRPQVYVGRLTSAYYRWGGFAEALDRCTTGIRVTNRQQVESALHRRNDSSIRELDELLLDVFVANLENRRVLHLDGR